MGKQINIEIPKKTKLYYIINKIHFDKNEKSRRKKMKIYESHFLDSYNTFNKVLIEKMKYLREKR